MNKNPKIFKELSDKKITREILSYGIFGILTTVISIVTYHICFYTFSISNIISEIVSWVISVLFAYVTNRLWVFGEKNNNIVKQMSEFFLCRLATGLLGLLIMFVGVDVLGLEGGIIKIISSFLVIVINYVASKLFIFKK